MRTLTSSITPSQRQLRRKIHQTITKVNDDIGRRYTFNTAIAAVMELINALARAGDETDNDIAIRQEGLETAVLLLSPIVPHITDALWHELGHSEMIIDARWPRADEKALVEDEKQWIVQVNGKLRGRIQVAADADRSVIEKAALADDNVRRFVQEGTIRKIIIVPDKLVNIVIS